MLIVYYILHPADVLKTIVQVGFEKSPYPIIINIENYCSSEQQVRVVQLLKSVLKKVLAAPSDTHTDSRSVLPSPAQLKGRVLLRCAKSDLPGDAADDEADEATTSLGGAGRNKRVRGAGAGASAGLGFGPNKARQVPLIQDLSDLVFLSSGIQNYSDLNAAGDPPPGVLADCVWALSENKGAALLDNEQTIERVVKYHDAHLRYCMCAFSYFGLFD